MNNVYKREQAKRDLEETFVFIGEQNFDAGLDFLFAAEQTFELLAGRPRLGSTRRFGSSDFAMFVNFRSRATKNI
jgi:plasmid stabilization system protein ParE